MSGRVAGLGSFVAGGQVRTIFVRRLEHLSQRPGRVSPRLTSTDEPFLVPTQEAPNASRPSKVDRACPAGQHDRRSERARARSPRRSFVRISPVAGLHGIRAWPQGRLPSGPGALTAPKHVVTRSRELQGKAQVSTLLGIFPVEPRNRPPAWLGGGRLGADSGALLATVARSGRSTVPLQTAPGRSTSCGTGAGRPARARVGRSSMAARVAVLRRGRTARNGGRLASRRMHTPPAAPTDAGLAPAAGLAVLDPPPARRERNEDRPRRDAA